MTERKGYSIGGNKKGACCAMESAEQRGLMLYGKSDSTTELDALHRVLQRRRVYALQQQRCCTDIWTLLARVLLTSLF